MKNRFASWSPRGWRQRNPATLKPSSGSWPTTRSSSFPAGPSCEGGFAAAAKAQASGSAPQFDGTSDIQEIKVSGDWAFMWSRLTVVATPPGGGAPITRAGHTLTVFNRQGGRWLLARDANLLAPVQPSAHDA